MEKRVLRSFGKLEGGFHSSFKGAGHLPLKTLKLLEFDRLLSEVQKLAKSPAGKEAVLKIRPKTKREEVERELSITDTFAKLLSERNLPLETFPDISKIVEKAKIPGVVLGEEELLFVLKVLERSDLFKNFFESLETRFEKIKFFGERLKRIDELKEALRKSIDETGEILDTASPKLKELRKLISVTTDRIKEKLQSIVNKNEDLRPDRIITVRNDRYVILVKSHFKKRFQAIIHDKSSSGQTFYVEPLSVVPDNNRLRELKAEEKREIKRILKNLSSLVSTYAEELEENFKTLVEIDRRYAVAFFSLKLKGTKPEFGNSVELKEVKHPLLMLSGQNVVPVTIKLKRGLVITGPNTGGKTVTLKTLGLVSLMAQSGFLIPAQEGSSLILFKNWFADIGDEQSIEQSLSTFSAHVKNVSEILKLSDENSLVLLDELGAGTDPVEGSTLAVAILSFLKEKKAKVVATTHFTPVKLFAYKDDYYDVATVLFDEKTLKPLYKLAYGIIGRSYALIIAKRYGIPEEVVKLAESLLKGEDRLADDILKALEEEYKRLERERKEVEKLKKELEKKREELHIKEREVNERLKKELSAYIEELERRTEEALREKEAEKARQKIKKVVVSVKNRAEILSEIKPKREVKVGDTVKLLKSGRKGKVVSVDKAKKTAVVQVGNLKVEVKLSQIEPVEEFERKDEKVNVNVKKPSRFFPELKVLGFRGDEALRAVEKFLDDANIVGVKRVKIVHGHGEGILKRLIREYLKESPYVKSFRGGKPEEGGDGVTVVELY
jgi:DNA mismatch repair protein MutS2